MGCSFPLTRANNWEDASITATISFMHESAGTRSGYRHAQPDDPRNLVERSEMFSSYGKALSAAGHAASRQRVIPFYSGFQRQGA
jgi:hypothetical protein